MRWGVIFTGDCLSMDELLALARRAEEAGADSLWTTELGREVFVPLAAIAGVTDKIRLGTGVATFARTPMHVETAAMAMAELTGNNFVLGLGTAPPAWNENWHGLPFKRPAARMREYVGCIRRMWMAGPDRPIDYDGEIIKVSQYRRFMPAPFPSVPIYLAAVGPLMLQLAGEAADGLLANVLNTPRYFRDVVQPNLQKGMAKVGREGAPFETCTLKICSVHEDGARARDMARPTIAFYASLPYFDVVLDPAGFADEKERIRAAAARNDLAAMAGAVSDPMVQALALAGTAAEVRDQLTQFDGLIDSVALRCPTIGLDETRIMSAHTAMIDAFAG